MKVLKGTVGGIVVLTLKAEFDTFVTGAFRPPRDHKRAPAEGRANQHRAECAW